MAGTAACPASPQERTTGAHLVPAPRGVCWCFRPKRHAARVLLRDAGGGQGAPAGTRRRTTAVRSGSRGAGVPQPRVRTAPLCWAFTVPEEGLEPPTRGL